MSPVPEYHCSSGRQCGGRALVLHCHGCREQFHGHLLTVINGEHLLCRSCQNEATQ